jgi:predicted porin
MKKTLVALSVLAAAGSAQAIELYNQDKVTVNMTGDVEIVYVKGTADGDEFKQEIQDADFGFDTRYAVNDDVQVGAFWEFSGADTNADASVGDVYMGLYSQSVGSIKFGKTATALDDAGIGSDYQFGVSSFFSNGTPFAGHEVVKYELDKGNFYGTVSYMQDKQGYNGLGENGNFFDAKLGGRVADFDFTGFVGQAEFKEAGLTDADGVDIDGLKETIWALEARYAGVENLNLELGYYSLGADPKDADSQTDGSIAAAADYTLNSWKFATGVSQTNPDEGDKVVNWFLNAGYALAPSTTAYAEVGGNNGEDNQTGFAVGLKAEF